MAGQHPHVIKMRAENRDAEMAQTAFCARMTDVQMTFVYYFQRFRLKASSDNEMFRNRLSSGNNVMI